ncbi:hypothetical protein WICPIJ_000625, partial [Wickerhamomyces pijperi]
GLLTPELSDAQPCTARDGSGGYGAASWPSGRQTPAEQGRSTLWPEFPRSGRNASAGSFGGFEPDGSSAGPPARRT